MIEIVQTGQFGKTKLLFDMHRLRARVFKDRLKWDVHVDEQGLEIDQFDLPEAVYLLCLDDQQRVIGSWRLLSSEGPTMIRDVWPEYLETLPMPESDDVFEVSRFAISSLKEKPAEALLESHQVVAKLFCALTELCISVGINRIFTLYDDRIAKVLQRIDCVPQNTSTALPIDGIPCRVGCFNTDDAMLARLRTATGIKSTVIGSLELPPILEARQKRWTAQEAACLV